MSANEPGNQRLKLMTTVAASYVGNNKVAVSEMPELLRSIYSALGEQGARHSEPEKATPAVPIKKSIHRDYLICLEDGKRLKMLKRHLKSTYDMTPDEYRAKWGLPNDYPMVAPGYAETRSALAKSIGLGQRKPEPDAEPQATDEPKARRGRKKQA